MTRRDIVIRLSAAAVILAGVFILAETSVRVVSALHRPLGAELDRWDPFGVKVVPIGELGYRQKPHMSLDYFNGTRATSNGMGYRGPEVSVPKPPGHFRIILLGGSTTHGWGVPDTATIDRYMRDELHRRWPDRTFEVVNLAFDGYDAYQLVERLTFEGLDFDPDVIVVNSGINDVRNARIPDLKDRDRRTLIFETELQRLRDEQERGRSRLRHHLRHHSYLIRLVSLAKNAWYQTRGPVPSVRVPPQEIVAYPEAADNFDLNLRRLTNLANSRDIPIVFSTPPSSLNTKFQPTDSRPRSYWLATAAATQAYRDTLTARMQSVTDSLRAEGYPAIVLEHDVRAEFFLDDCHLTPQGNAAVAHRFVEAIMAWIEAT